MDPLIAGVGSTKFGKHPDSSNRELFVDAAVTAIDDAGLSVGDVEELFVGNFLGDLTDDQAHVGAMMADVLGIESIPSVRVESACASASASARAGRHAIIAGEADVVLVGGVETMYKSGIDKVTDALANAADNEYENEMGLTFPGIYALIARVYMDAFDVSREDLAAVSVKNRKHGVANPISQFQKETTVEEVLESPLVASPLHLQDCCPITDGASAAVLVSASFADANGIDASVRYTASAQGGDTLGLHDRNDLTRLRAAERAASGAYEAAGITSDDIDVCEVHDCFTIAELLAIEALGFAGHGEGVQLTVDGDTSVNGSIPVNTSGGLIAKGHPVGATGVAQLVEITKQLEGRHPNQVDDPTTGLTHTVGGSGASCVVNILEVA